jgi:hypothetical protein
MKIMLQRGYKLKLGNTINENRICNNRKKYKHRWIHYAVGARLKKQVEKIPGKY